MSAGSVDYSEWKIILRNESGQQLVLYNENDRSLQVHNSANIVSNETIHFCKECDRPWPEELSFPRNESENHSAFMMDRNYFRLLDISSRKPVPSAATMLKYSTSPTSSKGSSKSKLSMHSTSAEDVIDASEAFKEFHPQNLSDSSINQGYYQRFFREDTKLGRGSGGSVFRCQHVLDGIELGAYAVKKVPVGDNHSWLNRMLREVHILENLRHSNIIEYKHAWLEYHQLSPFGPPIPCLFILMQLAQGGNLEEFVLMNDRQQFDAELFCDWFEQLCQGLAHLHRCGILHRDLKPSNILLNLGGPQNRIQLLITDFGECTDEHQNTSDSNRTGATGTIEFVAPELLKVDRKTGAYLYQQSKSTDIWSLGLVFYFMLTGRLPYPNVEDIEALKVSMCNLKSVPLPKEAAKLPKGFRKALAAMLQVDPELRPSIDQVLILIKERADDRKNSPIMKASELKPILPSLPAPIQSNLDENTRISLALLIICISVIPTYPQIPSFRRIILALAFTAAAMKTSRPRSALSLIISYCVLISAFYFNKID